MKPSKADFLVFEQGEKTVRIPPSPNQPETSRARKSLLRKYFTNMFLTLYILQANHRLPPPAFANQSAWFPSLLTLSPTLIAFPTLSMSLS